MEKGANRPPSPWLPLAPFYSGILVPFYSGVDIWLYLRFTFSYRNVEDLLAKRGLDSTYETVPQWVLKFGAAIARNLRRLRPKVQPALAFG
jgi:hypothetical protein